MILNREKGLEKKVVLRMRGCVLFCVEGFFCFFWFDKFGIIFKVVGWLFYVLWWGWVEVLGYLFCCGKVLWGIFESVMVDVKDILGLLKFGERGSIEKWKMFKDVVKKLDGIYREVSL